MDNCMVSIIIPFYNSDSTIRQALQSVLCQRLKGNLNGTGCENDCTAEVIIVDASDSFSEKMISGIYNPYGYSVRCIGGGVNMDAGEARNLGVKYSTGKYIAFLDADDWWEKDKLSAQLSIFAKNENNKDLKIVFTARRLCDENGRKTKKVIAAPKKVGFKELCHSNYISCSSVVMRRETAEEFPMKSGDIHEDYLCWLMMFRDSGYAVGINRPLLNYRSYRSSRSGKKIGSALMTYRTYKAAGFSLTRRLGCMMNYAFNGLRKYL